MSRSPFKGLLETRLDPTAENSRLDMPINFTEIPAGDPFAFMLPPSSEAETHSTPGNANISAGGKKARRQAANTRTGASVSSPTGTQEPKEDPQLPISKIYLAEEGYTPEPMADVEFFMSALGLQLVPKYSYPELEIASRQLENDLKAATKKHEDHKDASNEYAAYLLTTLSKGRRQEVARSLEWCEAVEKVCPVSMKKAILDRHQATSGIARSMLQFERMNTIITTAEKYPLTSLHRQQGWQEGPEHTRRGVYDIGPGL